MATLLAVLGVACATRERDLVVFAAASTEPAVLAWIADHPGLHVEASYAASSTLAQQLLAGAKADVFLSADAEWTAKVVAERGPSQPPVVLGRNTLVVVAPASAPRPDGPWLEACDGLLATGDPAHVPLGRYARAALKAAGALAAIEPRLVGAQDARAALALVEQGHLSCGIVYGSDAAGSGRVQVLAGLGEGAPATILGVALGDRNKQTTVQFLREIPSQLVAHGFLPP
jgi:molybdate transport system substrate-binding protein